MSSLLIHVNHRQWTKRLAYCSKNQFTLQNRRGKATITAISFSPSNTPQIKTATFSPRSFTKMHPLE